MAAPRITINEPTISYLSGLFLSIKAPQIIDENMNTPPYAAYTLPKFAGCNVGIIP
jgi:hypothetical protein